MTVDFAELQPKNPDGPLRVLVVGRISTVHQNIENLDASYEDLERYLRQHYSGPVFIKRYGERGSGWKIDRESIQEVLAEIATGTWDVVLTEDLGRAFRNPQHQYRFVYECVDHDTRLICTGDHLDTGVPFWEASAGTAVLRHAMQVPETRRRVKRTATYSFHRGGMVLKTRFGYRRLSAEDAASGQYGPKNLRIAKDLEATGIIREMRERILRGDNFSAVAEWLNDSGVQPGGYATSKIWTGRLVADFLRDPILQGLRRFRVEEHRMIYGQSRHRRTKNESPETEHYPELAHLSKEEQEEVWAAMDRHAPKRGPHPRRGTPRKATYWPGNHLTCRCGAELYWGADDKLRCRNAAPGGPRSCWNQVLVRAEQVRTKVLPALMAEVRGMPELMETLVDTAWKTLQTHGQRGQRAIEARETRLAELHGDASRIMDWLLQHPDSPTMLERLTSIERQIAEENKKKETIAPQHELSAMTMDEVASRIDDVVLHLSRKSYEFTKLMRRMFPEFRLVPVQALDSPQVHPRVKLTLPPMVDGGESKVLVIDAFESPLHIRHALDCRRLKESHPAKTLIQLGEMLGINKMTVKRGLAYARLIENRQTTDPYLELTEKPEKASRWRKQSLQSD